MSAPGEKRAPTVECLMDDGSYEKAEIVERSILDRGWLYVRFHDGVECWVAPGEYRNDEAVLAARSRTAGKIEP